MDAGTQSRPEPVSEPQSGRSPEVSVCESCPGTFVFLESENTEGWIASDVTVDIHR